MNYRSPPRKQYAQEHIKRANIEDFINKVSNLHQQSVMDISRLRSDAGYRIIDLTYREPYGPIGVNDKNLPFITNNIDSYKRAIRFLYGDEGLNMYDWAIQQLSDEWSGYRYPLMHSYNPDWSIDEKNELLLTPKMIIDPPYDYRPSPY